MVRRVWLLVLLVSLGSTWMSPGRRDLWVGDETKYSRVVWESLESGHILVPYLEGEPFEHKPPLHFWMIEAVSRVTGTGSTWTYVLPSLLSFILLALVAGRVSERMAGASRLRGAAIFASFWLPWISAQTARMDLAFTLAISLGSLVIFETLERDRWSLLPVAGLVFGVAVLIKGPMAAVIGIALFSIEWFLRRRDLSEGSGFRWLMTAGALFLTVAIPSVWLVAAILTEGPGYGSALIVDQSLGRVIDSWAHAEPPWFYLLRFPLTFFPWFLVVALGLWHTLARTTGPERRRARFLVSWFLVVIGSFSLISGKLDIYMLPAMVPAAALAARYVQLLSQRTELPGTGSRLVTAAISVICAVVAGAALWLPRTKPEMALLDHQAVLALLAITFVVSMAGLVFQTTALAGENERMAVLGAVSMTPLLLLAILLVPVLDEGASSRPLVESLRRTGVSPQQIGLYWTPHLWSRSMPVDYHHVRYDEAEELRERPPEIIAVRRDHAGGLGDLLDHYRRIDAIRMIGKDFDVYRRTE